MFVCFFLSDLLQDFQSTLVSNILVTMNHRKAEIAVLVAVTSNRVFAMAENIGCQLDHDFNLGDKLKIVRHLLFQNMYPKMH